MLPCTATEPQIQAAERAIKEAQRRRRAVRLPLDAPESELLVKEREAEEEADEPQAQHPRSVPMRELSVT